MGLLGMLAAGAGGGIRDASNASVQAQNILEADQAKERLRAEFYDARYNRKRQDQIIDAKSQGLLNQAVYERDRANKLSDSEIEHGRKMEIEGLKESGRNARSRDRINAGSGATGGGMEGDYITLADGTPFKPNDATSRMAANLVRIKSARDIPHAYEIIFGKDLASQAAGSIGGLTQGMVPEAMNMSRQFLGNRAASGGNTQQQSATTRDRYDSKTGNIIRGGDSQEDVNAATQRITEQPIRKPDITKPLLDNTQYDIPDIERNIPMNVIGEGGMRRSNMSTKTGVSVDQRTGDLIVNEIDPETGKMISVRVDPKTMLPVK